MTTVTYSISAGLTNVWVQVQVRYSDCLAKAYVAAVASHPTHVVSDAVLSPASAVPGETIGPDLLALIAASRPDYIFVHVAERALEDG